MTIFIKEFLDNLEVKRKGIELEVRTPDGGQHEGDLYISQGGLTWCKGKTQRRRGKQISWAEFIAFMDGR